MYTSFCKVITADNWEKNQPVPSASTNFQIFIGHYIHRTCSQFLIYLHQYLEREPDWAFHFFHLLFLTYRRIQITMAWEKTGSSHQYDCDYGEHASLFAEVSCAYASLDGAVLRCKMWMCPTVSRQHQKILFGFLCTRCPYFFSFCYCFGTEVEEEMAQCLVVERIRKSSKNFSLSSTLQI